MRSWGTWSRSVWVRFQLCWVERYQETNWGICFLTVWTQRLSSTSEEVGGFKTWNLASYVWMLHFLLLREKKLNSNISSPTNREIFLCEPNMCCVNAPSGGHPWRSQGSSSTWPLLHLHNQHIPDAVHRLNVEAAPLIGAYVSSASPREQWLHLISERNEVEYTGAYVELCDVALILYVRHLFNIMFLVANERVVSCLMDRFATYRERSNKGCAESVLSVLWALWTLYVHIKGIFFSVFPINTKTACFSSPKTLRHVCTLGVWFY